jgi:protein tyrosine/serine phosphatase
MAIMSADARTSQIWRSPRVWLVTLLLLAATGLGYRYAVRDNVFPRNFGVVEPGVLYRSAALTPSSTRRVVDQYHIRTIIDLGAYAPDSPADAVAARTAAAVGVRRHVFRLEGDGTGNPNAYVAALRIIVDPANQPVLVHCSSGAQRTGACVMLYRTIVQGQNLLGKIYEESFRYGHDPHRNTRLAPYLLDYKDKIAQAFRTGSIVAGFEPLDPPRLAARGPSERASPPASEPTSQAGGVR